MINRIEFVNLFPNQSILQNKKYEQSKGCQTLSLTNGIAQDKFSFKGKEPYTINDYRTRFAKDMKNTLMQAPSHSKIQTLIPHYDGLMALVKGDPENKELCNSFMRVTMRIAETQERLGELESAEYTLEEGAKALEQTPTELLPQKLAAKYRNKLSNIKKTRGEIPERPLHLGLWNETELLLDEVEIPTSEDLSFERVMGATKESERPFLRNEIDLARKNLDILRSANNPTIISEAETSLVNRGRFDLIREFMTEVPLHHSANGDVIAKPSHGAVVFDLASGLVRLGKQQPLARKFVESILIDKSIPTAVKQIVKGAVQAKV